MPRSLLLVLLSALLAFPLPAGATAKSSDDFRQSHVDPDSLARELSGRAVSAIQGERWEEASALLEAAHPLADGALRERITFFWAYALYRQGDEIVRANTTGDPAETRRALELFSAAMELVNTLMDRDDFDLEGLRLSGAAEDPGRGPTVS
jgi:hypothetical protein